MRLSGWIFMAIAWTLILSLATFCFSKIFKKGIDVKEESKNNDNSKR